MIHRRVTAAVVVVMGFALPATEAHAAGGTYDVVFCSSANRVFGGEIATNNAFSARSFCSDASNYNSVQIESVTQARHDRSARAFWRFASRSPSPA